MTINRTEVEEFVYETCLWLDEKDWKGFLDLCDPGFNYKVTAYAPEIRSDMTWLDRDRAEVEEFIGMLPKHNTDPNIEFFPEEGKYHYDGHRQCGVIFSPQQTRANQSLCPNCHKKLTVGVMYRIEELADRPDGFIPKNAIPCIHLIPLEEIISEALGVRVGTKTVDTEYERLVERGGSEFRILLEATPDELSLFVPPNILEGIVRMRQKKVSIIPGHDGVYGKITLFPERKAEQESNDQLKLFK